MNRYTTLGTGRQTKVIDVCEHADSRVVTTAPHEAATRVAAALQRLRRCTLSAMHPVAVALDGQPVHARRLLLAHYDHATSGASNGASNGSPAGLPGEAKAWSAILGLIDPLAAAVAGCPAPVVKAVRSELAQHLDGLDGVLVPAHVVAAGWRPSTLDVVISTALPGADDWPDTAGELGPERSALWAGYLGGSGAPVTDLLMAAHNVLGQLPIEVDDVDTLSFETASLADIYAESGYDNPSVYVRCDHLLAWLVHHEPDHVADMVFVHDRDLWDADAADGRGALRPDWRELARA